MALTTESIAEVLGGQMWHTGGGIMAAAVEHGRYRFYFGIESGSDQYLVWDIDRDDDTWRTGHAPHSEYWTDAQVIAKAREVMETLEGEVA